MDDPTKRAELVKLLAQSPGDLSHSDWLKARHLTSDPAEQQAMAVPEHRAFAREYVAEHPAAAPVMPVAALGYYLGKKAGLLKGRTPADFDQVFAGVEGTGQGLRDYFKGATK